MRSRLLIITLNITLLCSCNLIDTEKSDNTRALEDSLSLMELSGLALQLPDDTLTALQEIEEVNQGLLQERLNELREELERKEIKLGLLMGSGGQNLTQPGIRQIEGLKLSVNELKSQIDEIESEKH